jgi:type 1 glutamine amidotransferase
LSKRARIVFHLGGPAFHPVADQARLIREWLGEERFDFVECDGVDAFDALEDCDLFILMGLHWTGMHADWAGSMRYRPMTPQHMDRFERYVSRGGPILAHHGGIASYDDTPKFARLLGIAWIWSYTTHSPFGTYRVTPTSSHRLVEGVEPFEVEDEVYFATAINGDLQPVVHATTRFDGLDRPMVISAEGGRIAGAGRLVYLANGHDLRAFAAPAMKRLWLNAVAWLTEDRK